MTPKRIVSILLGRFYAARLTDPISRALSIYFGKRLPVILRSR